MPDCVETKKIEEAIAALQQEPTQEMLAHTPDGNPARRMQENGQFIVAENRRPETVRSGCGDKDR